MSVEVEAPRGSALCKAGVEADWRQQAAASLPELARCRDVVTATDRRNTSEIQSILAMTITFLVTAISRCTICCWADVKVSMAFYWALEWIPGVRGSGDL